MMDTIGGLVAKRKYERPDFLHERCTPEAYYRWLDRKADAHCKRDRKRGNPAATREAYMIAIHQAVLASNGLDAYTGQPLAWELISTYENNASRLGKRDYKKQFAQLPTVDHVGDGRGKPQFRICSWQTNDAKSDLSEEEFLELCRAVVRHHTRV